MYRLEHTMRNYAWGSRTAFAHLFDTAPSTEPQAELWFGTHPAAPSPLADGRSLAEIVELPFLLKVLAAEKALSIQAHPCPAQAAEGFARETAAGIPLDAPERNYRDPNHKPELLLALTNFSALCGFRPWDEAQRSWARLTELASSYLRGEHSEQAAGILRTVANALAAEDYAQAVETILGQQAASSALCSAMQTAAAANPDYISHDLALETALQISEDFPGDPGVLMALLLQRVDLLPGQAIYLSAGIIHAYLHGVGVEVMACSDNVLRGGLTNKHVDVAELLAVSCFQPATDPLIQPAILGEHAVTFRPEVQEFQLQVLRGGQQQPLQQPGPHVVLCISGKAVVEQAGQRLSLLPGQAVFVPAGAELPTVSFEPGAAGREQTPLVVAATSGAGSLPN